MMLIREFVNNSFCNFLIIIIRKIHVFFVCVALKKGKYFLTPSTYLLLFFLLSFIYLSIYTA